MKPSLATLFISFLACSCSFSTAKYDFKHYVDAHPVSFSPIEKAFSLLEEQGDLRFTRKANQFGVVSLTYADELAYDPKTKYSVEITDSIDNEEMALYETVSFIGSVTPSANPETHLRIRVNLVCAFWGDGDFEACKGKVGHTEPGTGRYSGCSVTTWPYSLVYPNVYVDSGKEEALPTDAQDFFVSALYEKMVIPLENALISTGSYADAIIVAVCPS